MALYNDFRPRRFSELVGNARLIRSLAMQVSAGRIHHAYLFCGSSGTGKTTIARLLAASICCDNVDGTGCCGSCPSCLSIQQGRNWDVLEMDSAHFRGVDDLDELVRKAFLFPLSGHKIYILDECHRLSAAAWDILLKLIEEPPPFLTILLCTTELAKIPATITSRCSVCHLDTPAEDDISRKLQQICTALALPIDTSHLKYCTSTAKGNFRAAENLLEQIYAEYITAQLERIKRPTI